MSGLPLVSFILPTRNRAHLLEKAMKAVLEEREKHYANLELLVIDGGSKDASVEVIQSYQDQIAYWCSQPDSGLAEAVNKGIRKSRGEIIRYLSDDDELVEGSTLSVVEYWKEHPDIDILAGTAVVYYRDNLGRLHPRYPKWIVGEVTWKDLRRWPERGFIAVESVFYRRSVFDTIGPWDHQYDPCPDMEYFFRVLKCQKKFYVLNKTIVTKYYHENSGSVKDRGEVRQKTFEAIRRYAGLWSACRYRSWTLNKSAGSLLRTFGTFFQWITYLCHAAGFHPLKMLRQLGFWKGTPFDRQTA